MSAFQLDQTVHGFTVNTIEEVTEIDGTAYIMNHALTGAELLYLDTEDEEKGFAIGFRTHPVDNTGAFHIIEHSVLCGSDKYPVKEPFVHLLKSSMQTFLNAATAADCTVYPVASTNEKDLMNLMSIYLDAVFHPTILHEPRILKQEGWHYELDDENLIINGVVYNEMKGMLAQPAAVLSNALYEELFPDTSYRYEEGGVPGEIEALSYEQFIDTYKRHYRPNNAAIVLYGHFAVEAFLGAIDEQLLSSQNETNMRLIGDPNPCGIQEPVISTDRKVFMNTLPQDAEIRFGSVFGDANDTRRELAMEILGYALLGTNESPLKRMLIETGISSVFNHRIMHTNKLVLTISAQGVKANSAQTFFEALKDGCQKILAQGVSKELLKAAEFKVEFEKRTGGINGQLSAADQMMACLARWGAGCPLNAEAVRYNADLEFLKAAIETDYYDQLLREALLESVHYALVELCPTSENQKESNLSDSRPSTSNLNADELERIAQEADDLKAFQSAPDSPEALKSLPRLDRADCLEPPYYAGYHLIEEENLSVLRHEYAEDGIAHIMRYYDLSSLSLEDFRYIETLISILSQTDTLRHSAAEVLQLKDGRLGLLNSSFSIGTHYLDGSICSYVWVYTCSLENDIEFTSDFVDEILHETVFENRDKLRETIARISQRKKTIMIDAMPHVIASMRAEAHIKASAVISDAVRGPEGYSFIKELQKRCEDDVEADKVLRRLEILCSRVFGAKPVLISFSGSDDAYERFINSEKSIIPKYEKQAEEVLSNITEEEKEYANHPILAEMEPIPRGDEAFAIPGNVAYCATSVDVSNSPSVKSGCWAVANCAASFDYLWNNVRVKGGAYGASFREKKTGTANFSSFRDPAIDSTLKHFDDFGMWLRRFEPTDEDLDGYVISATASYDSPTKGFLRVLTQSQNHLIGQTLEDRARIRREIVSCTLDDVQQLGKELDECTGTRCSVVFANRELIDQSEREFIIHMIQ